MLSRAPLQITLCRLEEHRPDTLAALLAMGARGGGGHGAGPVDRGYQLGGGWASTSPAAGEAEAGLSVGDVAGGAGTHGPGVGGVWVVQGLDHQADQSRDQQGIGEDQS